MAGLAGPGLLCCLAAHPAPARSAPAEGAAGTQAPAHRTLSPPSDRPTNQGSRPTQPTCSSPGGGAADAAAGSAAIALVAGANTEPALGGVAGGGGGGGGDGEGQHPRLIHHCPLHNGLSAHTSSAALCGKVGIPDLRLKSANRGV